MAHLTRVIRSSLVLPHYLCTLCPVFSPPDLSKFDFILCSNQNPTSSRKPSQGFFPPDNHLAFVPLTLGAFIPSLMTVTFSLLAPSFQRVRQPQHYPGTQLDFTHWQVLGSSAGSHNPATPEGTVAPSCACDQMKATACLAFTPWSFLQGRVLLSPSTPPHTPRPVHAKFWPQGGLSTRALGETSL